MYINKPIIPVMDAAATSLINNGYGTIGGAIAYACSQLEKIKIQADLAFTANNVIDREKATKELIRLARNLDPN